MKPAQSISHLFLGRHAYFRREVLRLAGWQAVLLMQNRSIEWFLRALARMGAVRLFLRARAVIQYVVRAASTS